MKRDGKDLTLEEMLAKGQGTDLTSETGKDMPWGQEVPEPEVKGLDPMFELNVAADLLLDQLVPSIRDFAKELADIQLHIPRWQLVIGSLLAQYQSGTLSAPSIDPGWTSDRPTLTHARCEVCGNFFEPERIGQRFCSNACGVKWNQSQRPKKVVEAKAAEVLI